MSTKFHLQAANRGKKCTVAQWKAALEALHAARDCAMVKL